MDCLLVWVNHFLIQLNRLLAHVVFAIPAVRGIEFGTGFAAAKMFGSEHNDAIMEMGGKTKTNHAGGVVGGITNGNELVFRISHKTNFIYTKRTGKFELGYRTSRKIFNQRSS